MVQCDLCVSLSLSHTVCLHVRHFASCTALMHLCDSPCIHCFCPYVCLCSCLRHCLRLCSRPAVCLLSVCCLSVVCLLSAVSLSAVSLLSVCCLRCLSLLSVCTAGASEPRSEQQRQRGGGGDEGRGARVRAGDGGGATGHRLPVGGEPGAALLCSARRCIVMHCMAIVKHFTVLYFTAQICSVLSCFVLTAGRAGVQQCVWADGPDGGHSGRCCHSLPCRSL